MLEIKTIKFKHLNLIYIFQYSSFILKKNYSKKMLNGQERAALQNSVKNYFVKNPKTTKAEAANHFVKEGICRKTAYNYINRHLT